MSMQCISVTHDHHVHAIVQSHGGFICSNFKDTGKFLLNLGVLAYGLV